MGCHHCLNTDWWQNHEKYKHKVLVAVSEFVTMNQLNEEHQQATGKLIPAVPAAFAWLVVKMNKGTQELYFNLPPLSSSTDINGASQHCISRKISSRPHVWRIPFVWGGGQPCKFSVQDEDILWMDSRREEGEDRGCELESNFVLEIDYRTHVGFC